MACRTARAKRDLVRVVRTPDGRLLLDPTGRANGRGAYLCRDTACWTLATRRGTLDRALGTPIPDDLRAILEAGPDHDATPTSDSRSESLTTTSPGGGIHGTK